MKFSQISLAARNALIYFVLFIMGLGVSNYVLFSYSAKEIVSLTEENLEHNGELVALRFESYLNQMETDLNQLAYSPLLGRYINRPSNDNLALLTDEYRAFLRSKASYFQVRLISANSGDELIRVERNKNSILSADLIDLQNKEDRDYFKEILLLQEDSSYFSKIDLNKEYGAISQPIIPTLRLAKLLKTDSLGGVMVIINVDLNALFSDLKSSLPNDYELRVFNEEGHYLIHPDKNREFTFEFGLDPFYNKEFDQTATAAIESNRIFSDDEAIYKFTTLSYKRPEYKLVAAISAKNATIFASFYTWRTKVILVSVAIALFFLLIAFIYLRKQVRELKTITNELVLFTNHQIPYKLPIDRKDEIGDLARGFELMSNRVSESHAELESARKLAEVAYNEKNEFLENMSHEIRNPLQSILGTIQILEQNQIAAHQTPYINALKFSATQLKSLVTDVLDYSKIKQNQIDLVHEWVNLNEFCLDLLKALNYQAISKGIEIKFDASDRLLTEIYWLDRTRFYQILNNLLMNALKFTPSGGCVMLLIHELPVSPNRFMFEIKDNGLGISEENIARILERSYTSDYVTGAGLGLTIVQKLLNLFDSRLEVESILGRNTSFYFEIDLTSQSIEEKTNISETNCWADESIQPKILVLEDDLVLLDWYNYIFRSFEIVCLNDPIKLQVGEVYDLIISDLNFEKKTYVSDDLVDQLSVHLRPNGRLILVTGEDLKTTFGEFTVLTKPIKIEDLWPAIHSLFVELNYGTPYFGNFEQDYDGQKDLVKRALKVLVQEWNKDQRALIQVVANRDQLKFDDLKHKMITSIRRLQLNQFEELLNHVSRNLLVLEDEDLNCASQKIDFILMHYIELIDAYQD